MGAGKREHQKQGFHHGRFGSLDVEWIEDRERWQIAVLRDLKFPLEEKKSEWLNQFFVHLEIELGRQTELGPELILQFAHLHLGGNARLLTERGRIWRPRMGLGVFPDQPPPRLWVKEDFEKIPEGNSRIRPLMTKVLHIGASHEIKHDVVRTFLLSGSVTQIYAEDFPKFLDACKGYLLPKLTDSAFQGFLFYMPLLNAASFHNATGEQLDGWLPGVAAYVSESHDDNGLIVAFRGNLERLFDFVDDAMEKERVVESQLRSSAP